MNNELSPKMKGTITELECASYLMKLGYAVSTPLGDTCPYDLIVDINHRLYKIQCKTSTCNEETIVIDCTTNINTRTRLETHTYSHEDVDFFATFYNNKCYLVPFDEVSRIFVLRLSYPKNHQRQSIHWAEDYEASFIIDCIVKQLDVSQPSTSRKSYKHNVPTKYRWITNGIINTRISISDTMPEGFRLGRSGKCNQHYQFE